MRILKVGYPSRFREIGLLVQSFEFKIVKVVKKRQMFKTPPALFISYPALFQILVCDITGQDLAHRYMSKPPKRLQHIQKIKVMEMVQIRFYSLMETTIKLLLGLAME
jgi:hypothetical protein